MTGPGYGYVAVRMHQIPDHPKVALFEAKGYVNGAFSLPNGALPFTFSIKGTDGKARKGNAAFLQK